MISPFNNWITAKVLAFLTEKEGCGVVKTEVVADGNSKTIVQDAFGFRYEIEVRLVGRVSTETPNEYGRVSSGGSFLAVKEWL